jgi:hypothetical protein
MIFSLNKYFIYIFIVVGKTTVETPRSWSRDKKVIELASLRSDKIFHQLKVVESGRHLRASQV